MFLNTHARYSMAHPPHTRPSTILDCCEDSRAHNPRGHEHQRRASRRATRHGQWPSRGVRRPRRSPPHTPRVAKGDPPRSLAFARRSPDSPLPTLIMPRRAPAPNIALALHPTPRGDRDTAGNASGVLKVADAPAWLAQRFWSLALGGGCSRPPVKSDTVLVHPRARMCEECLPLRSK